MSVADANFYLSTYAEGGYDKGVFMALLASYQTRFPARFAELDPQVFDMAAGFIKYEGQTDILARLRDAVKSHPQFTAAIDNGIRRADEIIAQYGGKGSTPAKNAEEEGLDLTETPARAGLTPV